jgi:hypothetical protein
VKPTVNTQSDFERIRFLGFARHPVFSQKHSVSETGSVSVFRQNEDGQIQFPKRCVFEKILDDG